MQLDFHYYATYCAAILSGYTHEDSVAIAYSAQFVDCCSRTLLKRINGPDSAATTQLQLEMMDTKLDPIGLQDITRIWASFHFLPGNLLAKRDHCSRRYLRKYRLICKPNGPLLVDTVELARGKSLQAAGLAMHILADTWAHMYFAGTPSYAINNTNNYFFEIVPDGDGFAERPVRFNHNPSSPDDPEQGIYTNSIRQATENTVMNLGHGRAGHLPDYSFARYRYTPAWGEYREVVKDNPTEYYHAFCQMIYALKYLNGKNETFETEKYDEAAAAPWKEEIMEILCKRQLNAEEDWKRFGEKLSGREIEDFDIDKYLEEYMAAAGDDKDETFLGKFILAALAQKSMVTNKIFISGSLLAGISVDFNRRGFRGIRDFRKLVEEAAKTEVEDVSGIRADQDD